jgi:broad specificity phosphatase PhoE
MLHILQVIVTHGLAFRLFLMRWFHWSVEQFETTYNPGNGEVAIINRDSDSGYYVLDPDVAQVWKH